MKRVFYRSGDRFGVNVQKHRSGTRRFYFQGRTLAENDTPERPKHVKRLIAFCLAVVFLGGVIFTAWPRLYLPSMDFIFESIGLAGDSRVEGVRPAVVTLTVLARKTGSSGMVAQRHGTGFNIDPAGVIVTNRHVVRDALRIAVSFPEDGVYKVKKSAFLEECDVAVLVLENGTGDLPVAALGDSDQVRSGDKVFVIGNPLGVERVVVGGAIGKTFRLPGCRVPVMELVAPIHPGHSGSPVVDKNGRVVGVVFGSIRTEDEIRGLAIPVNHVRGWISNQSGSRT